MRPEILAIIPARGGSKRLPGKNVKLLCGKPLIAYTIEAALGADFVHRTVVSTEDKEIAKIARKYGAEVIKRPNELATDTTLIQPVLEHAVKFLEEKEGYRPDIIVLLNPTSPLRGSQDIDRAAHDFIQGGAETLISVYPCYLCLWRRISGGGYVANYDVEHKPRTQDMPIQLRENGAIYMASRKFLLENHNLLGKHVVLSRMAETASIDIDTVLDFIIAEAILNASVTDKSQVKGA